MAGSRGILRTVYAFLRTVSMRDGFSPAWWVFRLADAAAAYPIPEIGGQYRALVLVLPFTGLRWGEVAG